MSIKDLLAVLDMSEWEQWKWLDVDERFFEDLHGCSKGYVCTEGRKELADLAFRLRDEVKELPDFVFSKAWHLIVAKEMYHYDWSHKEWMRNFEEFTGSRDAVPNSTDREIFALYEAKPIHWIIAALIAKELAKEKKCLG